MALSLVLVGHADPVKSAPISSYVNEFDNDVNGFTLTLLGTDNPQAIFQPDGREVWRFSQDFVDGGNNERNGATVSVPHPLPNLGSVTASTTFNIPSFGGNNSNFFALTALQTGTHFLNDDSYVLEYFPRTSRVQIRKRRNGFFSPAIGGVQLLGGTNGARADIYDSIQDEWRDFTMELQIDAIEVDDGMGGMKPALQFTGTVSGWVPNSSELGGNFPTFVTATVSGIDSSDNLVLGDRFGFMTRRGSNSSGGLLVGDFERFSVIAVPEPTAASLAFVVAAAWLGRGRLRRRWRLNEGSSPVERQCLFSGR